MIKSINLNKVASYKNIATLQTDKKINLVYGLNGSGKSTFSNYLHHRTETKYKDCSIDGLDENYEILVYNNNFIQDNFFEADNLKGIFTLSKENKEAKTKIADALKEIKKLEIEEEIKKNELEIEDKSLDQKIETAKNTIWKIKTDYSGGDRVLEFCLEGYKGSKDNLFNYIISLTKPHVKPIKSVDDLKTDLQSISGDNAQKYLTLPQVTFTSQNIETETLFSKQIIGNENSSVSQLIKELDNSDWVKAGLDYIKKEETQENSTCPFCQEQTISNILVENIRNYFDASYEADINNLNSLLDDYLQSIQSIPSKNIFETNPKFEIYKKDFEIKYNSFLRIVEDNKKLIENKIKTPSIPISLKESTKTLEELNEVIIKINLLITEHNNNIDQKEVVKSTIKKVFWEIMRWEYDQTISSINLEKITSKSKIDILKIELNEYAEEKIEQKKLLLSSKNTLLILMKLLKILKKV